ncbi:hypothetical protein HJC23_002151 [Cyclotella cryptica]|uniref:Uncharacterized protein n=1 Tax=Cyclotella cryptica TaxID=29204 RepID=A0ABD3Q6S1_9STRA
MNSIMSRVLSFRRYSVPSLLVSILHLVLFANGAIGQYNESKEYSRYGKYPPYCSTPQQMENRAIPPLQYETSNSTESAITPRLVHVTALIRHGARTPWAGAPTYKCWNGYWENPQTGIWNCDLKTYISPPSTGKERVVNGDGGILEEEPDFLFEKRYDALMYQNGNSTGNELNGTCQLGQLLMRGYDQEMQNGLHLRHAYFYDGNNTSENHGAANPSMRLWDMASTNNYGTGKSGAIIGDPSKKIYQEPNLRYRADDEQRTLMSGQILLRGLFGPEILAADDDESTIIRLHTGDYKKDVLVINKNICPRVAELEAEAYDSEEFKRWNETSVEVQIIRKFAQSKMGLDVIPGGILDCLMTTMCTDRPLPELLDDYDGSLGPTSWNVDGPEGIAIVSEKDFTNIFERLVNYAVKQETFPYKYNDAALAKLGMGPLWKEIMSNILPIVDFTTNYTFGREPAPKLALFSGHDTTLMPILATLGQDVWSGSEWAPYASMVLIEVYEMLNSSKNSEFPSGYAFRLIYNGEVLTSRMERCSSELCDSQVLVSLVMQFAMFEERDCTSSNPASDASVESFDESEEDSTEEPKQSNSRVNPRQKWLLLGVSLLSATIGSIITRITMRRHYQSAYRHASDSERELNMAEASIEPNYARNSRTMNSSTLPGYAEESDEDRII